MVNTCDIHHPSTVVKNATLNNHLIGIQMVSDIKSTTPRTKSSSKAITEKENATTTTDNIVIQQRTKAKHLTTQHRQLDAHELVKEQEGRDRQT